MRKWIYRAIAAMLMMILVGGAAGAFVIVRWWSGIRDTAESFDLAVVDKMPAVSEVFDATGARMGRLEGEVRYTVGVDALPATLINAVIAREDNRFYEHHGVDYRGIVRAAWRNVTARRVEEGASTITQQLARNTYELPKDRWQRKLVEAALARRLERHFSKREILGAYFNRIYFGDGVYGVETAARLYFGKPAADLGLSEAAILAGLIRSPNRLSPKAAPEAALVQRDVVLDVMQRLGLANAKEVEAAKKTDVPVTKRRMPMVTQDYAMDGIRRELEILLSPEQWQMGGLRIHTTIDPRLQAIASDLVNTSLHEVESEPGFPHAAMDAAPPSQEEGEAVHSPYLQGALVAVENATGALRAIVGGRDFRDSPYNRALLANRQVGSTFKPFVYAAAFERGMSPAEPVSDGEIRPGEILDAPEKWSPKNSDGKDSGIQPASWGLIKSRNTMSLRVGNWAGLESVKKLGEMCGVSAEIPRFPSIYLGAFESTLADVTSAYTVFANQGIRRQSYLIEQIEDRNGRNLYRAAHVERRCLRPQTAWAIQESLIAVTRSGTAAQMVNEGFKGPAAGKTGTTDDYKDAWFVGYTSDLTCGVWVGFDKPQTIMNRGYGSALALPIWASFMSKATERQYTAKAFEYAGRMENVSLCSVSGRLATAACQATGTLEQKRVPEGSGPRDFCTVHHSPMALTYPISESNVTPMAGADGVEVRRAAPVDTVEVRRAVPNIALPPVEVLESRSGRPVRLERREGGMTIYPGEAR